MHCRCQEAVVHGGTLRFGQAERGAVVVRAGHEDGELGGGGGGVPSGRHLKRGAVPCGARQCPENKEEN